MGENPQLFQKSGSYSPKLVSENVATVTVTEANTARREQTNAKMSLLPFFHTQGGVR